MPQVYLEVVCFDHAEAAILAIRQAVFHQEQGVDPDLDFDGQDPMAWHVVATIASQPVGTARIRYLSNTLAKLERVAVLPAYRGQGIGYAIVQTAIQFLAENGISEVKLHAQSYTKDFYQKLGFYSVGDEFLEAEIPHIEMRQQITISESQSTIEIDDN
ncbi:MAG: GNAT family N-acetyltransferase [Synechococcales cyanobacterium M58_A2018_015]|nr:GNAT family N-acetyltransferase [Synechococcales cyanobacterium M58_A2018_015]